jgi:hypothetical protein
LAAALSLGSLMENVPEEARRAGVDGAEAAAVPAGPWMRMIAQLDSASSILTV